MSLATCPTTVIDAPIERVWELLSEPSMFDRWWDAQTRTIAPAGAAHAGQLIEAQTIELGKTWDVRVIVESVDAPRHTLDLTTRGPLGITVRNHIVCTVVDDSRTRVSFG
jgi:ligand-binding SRPBCC domain-containing protein